MLRRVIFMGLTSINSDWLTESVGIGRHAQPRDEAVWQHLFFRALPRDRVISEVITQPRCQTIGIGVDAAGGSPPYRQGLTRRHPQPSPANGNPKSLIWRAFVRPPTRFGLTLTHWLPTLPRFEMVPKS